jgi:hypothetical protein
MFRRIKFKLITDGDELDGQTHTLTALGGDQDVAETVLKKRTDAALQSFDNTGIPQDSVARVLTK